MPNLFMIRSLGVEQIALAYPLVRVLDPDLTLDRWRDYARSFIGPPKPPERRDIITAQSEQGHIHGLATCQLKPDLRRGHVLLVENFVSLDLTGGRSAAAALIRAAEQRARAWDCDILCLSLLDPQLRHCLCDVRHPAAELLKTAGYREEPLRLSKSLAAARQGSGDLDKRRLA